MGLMLGVMWTTLSVTLKNSDLFVRIYTPCHVTHASFTASARMCLGTPPRWEPMCVGINMTQILGTWVSFLSRYIPSQVVWHSCVGVRGHVKLASMRLRWRNKYPDPLTQTTILGLICFCIPGMFIALNGLGAPGKVDATTTDNANTALAVAGAVCAILAGVRITCNRSFWGLYQCFWGAEMRGSQLTPT